MLGIRLTADVEAALDRHAKALGRAKSVIARDWIVERLERESIDAQMAHAARLLAAAEGDQSWRDEMSNAMLGWLDEEDGGYDWGPDGLPDPR